MPSFEYERAWLTVALAMGPEKIDRYIEERLDVEFESETGVTVSKFLMSTEDEIEAARSRVSNALKIIVDGLVNYPYFQEAVKFHLELRPLDWLLDVVQFDTNWENAIDTYRDVLKRLGKSHEQAEDLNNLAIAEEQEFWMSESRYKLQAKVLGALAG